MLTVLMVGGHGDTAQVVTFTLTVKLIFTASVSLKLAFDAELEDASSLAYVGLKEALEAQVRRACILSL